ncbi:EscN/YscN/HrcN family type III secretion system ATPase [Chitiniphilus shinanonensis]|uniref:EscN/YscN/HrcN family type III secretion system ATPase n=1 Tax=Chitiniphilus shinanonensis TaxID=553088 RepID=A0ABQ6BSH5_9NEIS|nr:FliI/YscN family ATPase [Chitiniphilus shinanonensis]GLS04392.1 EscN/YscN/HrcN family type III secretion system ATPase [Chitiniphilus shinanonensis]
MISNRFERALRREELISRVGQIVRCAGTIVEADGPDAYLGEICEIASMRSGEITFAEVIGINNGKTLLFPYGDVAGVSVGCEVFATGRLPTAKVGNEALGKVLNAFGEPYADDQRFDAETEYPLNAQPLNPLKRTPISQRLHTGIKVIDHFLSIGVGQKIGIFAGGGVGKTSLLQQIVQGTDADICVIALIGERGREVLDFVRHISASKILERTVVVAATSDQPAIMRQRAAYYATALAEYFRDQSKNVLLVMDSVTRFGMAQREIGLAIGDMPTARGYTVSTFSNLTRLVERCGAIEGKGSISGVYTILVEGDDLNEPLSDTMRATLDGHIVLSRELANERRFPAVDLLHSTSRVMPAVVDKQALSWASQLIRVVAFYERYKELVNLGVYEPGSNPKLDQVLNVIPVIQEFLSQDSNVLVDAEVGRVGLAKLFTHISEIEV